MLHICYNYEIVGPTLSKSTGLCVWGQETSVQMEGHPAGDSPVSSGRSFGRGYSGTYSEYPVLTGPPVSTKAPAINRSFGRM